MDKVLMKSSHDEIQLHVSQAMLQGTDTEICAICFVEDDKDGICNYIEWISCSICCIRVHTTCAKISSSDGTQEKYNCHMGNYNTQLYQL